MFLFLNSLSLSVCVCVLCWPRRPSQDVRRQPNVRTIRFRGLSWERNQMWEILSFGDYRWNVLMDACLPTSGAGCKYRHWSAYWSAYWSIGRLNRTQSSLHSPFHKIRWYTVCSRRNAVTKGCLRESTAKLRSLSWRSPERVCLCVCLRWGSSLIDWPRDSVNRPSSKIKLFFSFFSFIFPLNIFISEAVLTAFAPSYLVGRWMGRVGCRCCCWVGFL